MGGEAFPPYQTFLMAKRGGGGDALMVLYSNCMSNNVYGKLISILYRYMYALHFVGLHSL